MKPPEIGIRSLAAVARDPRRSTSEYERCLGLGAECTKASAAASGRRSMSLDIPSYRTSGYAVIQDLTVFRPRHAPLRRFADTAKWNVLHAPSLRRPHS